MTKNFSPDVAVILVNWNGWRDTLECLDSLRRMRSPGRMHVLVTDNHSSDDSIKRIIDWMSNFGSPLRIDIETLGPLLGPHLIAATSIQLDDRVGVTLVCNGVNEGFAVGNNLGMAYAAEDPGVRFFWILNNDTLVRPDTLELLVARMESDPGIGICGSTLVYHHDPAIVQAYGGVRYSFWSGRGWPIGGGESYRTGIDAHEIEAAMNYVSGASMLVSLDFYRQVGPMSEAFFLYNEELEWAWRARGRFRLGCEPRSVVLHKEGASIGTVSLNRGASPLSEFYQARNKLKFTLANVPWCFPTVWLFLLAKALRLYLHGLRQNAMVVFLALLGRQRPAMRWSSTRNG